MAADAVAVSRWRSITTFVRESYHEIRYKTTWPDFAQVRQASIAILVFVLLVGLVISILDGILHGLLVNLIPSLFR
jgi:preprotein translocase SecE subunit